MLADEHAQQHFHWGGMASMHQCVAIAFAEVRSHLLVELVILQQSIQPDQHGVEPACRLRDTGKKIFGFIAIHQHVWASLFLCLLPLPILPHFCPLRHALKPLHRPHFAMHTSTRQVEHRLVELDLQGRTLTLKVKWSDFQLITRSVSRSNGFQDAQAMMPMRRTLLTQLDGGDRPVRLLGVSVSNLLSRDEVQRTLQVTALPLWDME